MKQLPTNRWPMWAQVILGGFVFAAFVGVPGLLVGTPGQALMGALIMFVFGICFFSFYVIRDRLRKR